MTPGEYRNAINGYFKHETEQTKYKCWLTGLTVGIAMSANKEHPYPSYDEFFKEKQEEDSEEDLFLLAKEKGIEIPPEKG
jgi:hypothetical protein